MANLNKAMNDRMLRFGEDEAYAFIEARLKDDRDNAVFAGKHVAPPAHAEVPDDTAARLVVASPRFPHRASSDESPALAWAKDVLEHRGNSPRLNRNMLVFAAFDEETHSALVESAKSYLAWKSIVDDRAQPSGGSPTATGDRGPR